VCHSMSASRRFRRQSRPSSSRRQPAGPSDEPSAFRANPLAYFEALGSDRCPYDGAPLRENPSGASEKSAEQANEAAKVSEAGPLRWCHTCGRGFGKPQFGTFDDLGGD
jgi:hypothetical protein